MYFNLHVDYSQEKSSNANLVTKTGAFCKMSNLIKTNPVREITQYLKKLLSLIKIIGD